MGQEFVDAARDHPDVVLVAGADTDPNRLDVVRASSESIAVTTDAMRVVNAANVDAVIVATPPDSHARVVLAALAAGKAVLCEKPLASRIEDGAKMVALARASGLVNLIHFPLCDRQPVLEIERAVRAGELGALCAVETRLLFPRWPREFQAHARWIATRNEGGFLREVFTHFAYLTDRIVGPLTVADVHLRAPGHGVAESYVAARFAASGVPVTLFAMAHAAMPETYEWTLFGELKSYRLTAWRQLERFENGQWQPVVCEGDLGSERTRLTELARAVRGEVTRLPDFATGHRIQCVIEACHGVFPATPLIGAPRARSRRLARRRRP